MLSGKHSAHIVKIIMKNIDLYNYFKNENIFKDPLSLDIFPIYSKNDIVAVQLEYENEYFYIEYEIRCNKYQNGKYDINIYFIKKLSDRMYHLADGTLVQRDWYSSFLLYCYDDKIEEINKTKCRTEFEKHYKREKALIEWIQANQIKILNSGIKTA